MAMAIVALVSKSAFFLFSLLVIALILTSLPIVGEFFEAMFELIFIGLGIIAIAWIVLTLYSLIF